jgi:hypothetical protein
MTRAQAKPFRKAVYAAIRADINKAKTAALRESDVIQTKLDTIEAFAFSAIYESYPGSNRKRYN